MIQRWKLGKGIAMFQSRNGAWVRHADHEAVVNELRRHCAELRQNMNRTDLQVQELVELVEFYKEECKRAQGLLDELQQRYEPELEYARDLGRCEL